MFRKIKDYTEIRSKCQRASVLVAEGMSEAQAASLAGIGVNQWFRDNQFFYVRTGMAAPEGSPERYPCYIVGYKNSHVRAGTITSQNLFSPGLPAMRGS